MSAVGSPHGALVLRPLVDADERQAMQAHAELTDEGYTFLLGRNRVVSFPAYVDLLERQRHGEALAPGHVPSTFLVGEVDGRLVGRVSIRHKLTELLRKEGGHVGFAVRPSERRRGYASAMLRQSLRYLDEELGIERALVTCDDVNVASAGVIEGCGGVLEDVVRVYGKPVRRYWIG